jgi:hypothetical protein
MRTTFFFFNWELHLNEQSLGMFMQEANKSNMFMVWNIIIGGIIWFIHG